MGAYMQMGHDTENLVGSAGLERFEGVVLSPVNRDGPQLRRYVGEFRDKGNFDLVLDPQLYSPRSEYRHLPSHPYFPSDLDTADCSAGTWLSDVAKRVADYSKDLGVDCVCSPAFLPPKWTDEYYLKCLEGFETMKARLSSSRIAPVLSLCVGLDQLQSEGDAMRIASIVTSFEAEKCYLVVSASENPRREIQNAHSLTALMKMVSALEASGSAVLVSHCSSDLLLLKAAGATHCSTGKFFNLRRFSRSRFEEKDEGGKNIAYWFEQGLLAFLREVDIARVQRDLGHGNIGVGFSSNQFGEEIRRQLASAPQEPWVGLGWRQYLAWFANTENHLERSDRCGVVDQWLAAAEQRWIAMSQKSVFLDEAANDGSWVRRWRQALADFCRP